MRARALAFIMVPIVARTTEEMLRLVPNSYRDASIALGATKARTILQVVLPAASGSIITGVMLAIARVAGETAPLLFTALGSRLLTLDPSHPFPSLTVQVFVYATGPYRDEQNLAWAGLLILICLVFTLNLALRLAVYHLQRNRPAQCVALRRLKSKAFSYARNPSQTTGHVTAANIISTRASAPHRRRPGSSHAEDFGVAFEFLLRHEAGAFGCVACRFRRIA